MKVQPLKLSDAFAQMAEQLTVSDVTAARLQAKIAAVIAKKRLELGMTQKQFADKMQVSQGMVSKWESEDYNFTIESLAQIAEKLELQLDICMISESEEYRKINQSRRLNAWKSNWNKINAGNIIMMDRAV